MSGLELTIWSLPALFFYRMIAGLNLDSSVPQYNHERLGKKHMYRTYIYFHVLFKLGILGCFFVLFYF